MESRYRAICFTSFKLKHPELNTLGKELKLSFNKNFEALNPKITHKHILKSSFKISPELLSRKRLPRILCEVTKSFNALSLRNTTKVFLLILNRA